MRRVAYALIASGALMLGALTSASAGCYGGDCYDGGYRSSGPSYERYERYERPAYRSYYRSGCGDDCGYSSRPRYHTTYYERPSYGYYDDYNDGSVPYYRNSCDYGYGGCGGGYRYSSYSGCGYNDCGSYRYSNYSNYGGCGYSGCGYSHRRYYGGCGGYGYGCGYSTVRYGGAWMQTGPAYASWGGGGGGGWGGCRTTYIPYGWTWYRASSC
jgi:hypothetical protein